MNAGLPVTVDDVRAAARALDGALVRTPIRHSLTLSKIAGCEVWLKFENRQFTASFKERGALNRLLALSPEEKKRGVAAMSAGNHAQGVAYHAGRLGIPATIVMPLATPFTKVKHTRDFGARVVQQGEDLIAANAAARAIAEDEGLTFIHPYDDAKVIAGQGTAALEMLEDVPDLDMLVVPVGGGGLISGCAVAAKAMRPDIEVYGVQTALYPAMVQAMHGEPITATPPVQTIAEGIAVKAPGVLTTQICRALVKDVLVVKEAEIEHALAMLLEIEKTVVEGAAAAGFAALMANRALFAGRKVGVVLSGGNIDMRLLSNVILRELSREGRIMSLELEIEDRPGILARVSAIVGEAGGNILEVSHNRMLTGIPIKSATLIMVVEARDAEHGQEIRERLAAGGFIQNGGDAAAMNR
ncbi:MAG: threonine ammonia-lyase [Alphaproteobacteria bacterium]|nr:threonine ammonia-lyase [Alphaproteobacteria bacterium]